MSVTGTPRVTNRTSSLPGQHDGRPASRPSGALGRRGDHVPAVVVDPEQVQRRGDGRQVAVAHVRRSRSPCRGRPPGPPGTTRAAAGPGRTGWPSPSIRRAASTVGRAVAGRVDRVEVDGHAHLGGRPGGPQSPARPGRGRASGGARPAPRPLRRCGRARARRSRSRGTPSTTARSAWSSSAPGRRARRAPASRSRRSGPRCPGPASRRRPPAAAAGPSGRASATARCRWPAARRPAAGRSPGPAGLAAPVPPGCTRGQETENRYDFRPSSAISATSSP